MRTRQLKAFILAILLLLPCISQRLEAATLHVILACDTDAQKIGPGVKINQQKMHAEVVRIAEAIKCDLSEQQFSGDDMKAKSIADAINSLTVNNEDVIIFFFNGHGFRNKKRGQNPWPYFSLEHDSFSLDYFNILNILKEKKARFVLAIAECCNNVIPDLWSPPVYCALAKSVKIERLSPKMRGNYQKLFLDQKGMVAVSSSKIGQYSWIALESGGLYTTAFLKRLKSSVQQSYPSPDWVTILDQSAYDVWYETSHHPQTTVQEPQYEIFP